MCSFRNSLTRIGAKGGKNVGKKKQNRTRMHAWPKVGLDSLPMGSAGSFPIYPITSRHVRNQVFGYKLQAPKSLCRKFCQTLGGIRTIPRAEYLFFLWRRRLMNPTATKIRKINQNYYHYYFFMMNLFGQHFNQRGTQRRRLSVFIIIYGSFKLL